MLIHGFESFQNPIIIWYTEDQQDSWTFTSHVGVVFGLLPAHLSPKSTSTECDSVRQPTLVLSCKVNSTDPFMSLHHWCWYQLSGCDENKYEIIIMSLLVFEFYLQFLVAKAVKDVTALRGESELAKVIAEYQVPVILMFSKDSTSPTIT